MELVIGRHWTFICTVCEEVKPVLEPVTFMMTKVQSFSVKYCQKFQSRIENNQPKIFGWQI